MEELRLAMKAGGIPRQWRDRLATILGIQSLEDLAAMKRDTVDLAPRIYHRRIINLFNAYNIDRTMWDLPEDDN
jgi:hypothetical protein